MPSYSFEKISQPPTRAPVRMRLVDEPTELPEDSRWNRHLIKWRWVLAVIAPLVIICIIGYGSLGIQFKTPSYFSTGKKRTLIIPVEVVSSEELRRLGGR